MKIFVFLLASLSLTFVNSAPIPSPEANPEPCLEIILGILQLFLTTPRPRRRDYTTPDDFEPEPEPETTTELSSTDSSATEGDASGESADGPSINGGPSTTEGNPDDIPNEVVPRNADTIKRLRKTKKKQNNDWWFGGIKWQ